MTTDPPQPFRGTPRIGRQKRHGRTPCTHTAIQGPKIVTSPIIHVLTSRYVRKLALCSMTDKITGRHTTHQGGSHGGVSMCLVPHPYLVELSAAWLRPILRALGFLLVSSVLGPLYGHEHRLLLVAALGAQILGIVELNLLLKVSEFPGPSWVALVECRIDIVFRAQPLGLPLYRKALPAQQTELGTLVSDKAVGEQRECDDDQHRHQLNQIQHLLTTTLLFGGGPS
mmetsp:Transcript_30131/g.74852  ORF Transcript_30131/g.74852 Transcript_30131/m.74852 type:complete len:227 (-) Transcript_30131:861-1541(-)